MKFADLMWATCLIVDKRYESERDRIIKLVNSMGLADRTSFFIDGDGQHNYFYDQTTLELPNGWIHGQGAYQHFRALQEIVRDNREWGRSNFLFIEDDCVLTEDFTNIEFPDDWDIMYFGANHSNSLWYYIDEAKPSIMRVMGSLTTHCVAFNHTVYDAILELEPTHVIDKLIADRIQPFYNCYAVWPNTAIQKPGLSHLWNQQVDYTEIFSRRNDNCEQQIRQ